MYEGEIIYFLGGLNDYIGALDANPHPNGAGWWRINNPCIVESYAEGNQMHTGIAKLGGPHDTYLHFVDIYIPPAQSIVEIRVLNRKSDMYKLYNQQISQPKLERIVLPQGKRKYQ